MVGLRKMKLNYCKNSICKLKRESRLRVCDMIQEIIINSLKQAEALRLCRCSSPANIARNRAVGEEQQVAILAAISKT
jgi:hypothetical protein